MLWGVGEILQIHETLRYVQGIFQQTGVDCTMEQLLGNSIRRTVVELELELSVQAQHCTFKKARSLRSIGKVE